MPFPSHRLAHYALLAAVAALLTLPNLGGPALWDMDEGVNAECAREMMETGTWVVPTYNYDLRTAKPVLLYWLQRASYNLFGVSEWAARLPAAALSLGTVLVVYELGRRMFGAATGLLAGIVLASAVQFCLLAHAATPDAPLVFFTTLTFYLFWVGHDAGGRRWFLPCAATAGLAVLTKGPVGLALPGLVVLLYFAWNREFRRLLDRRLIHGILVFLLVAAPWYGLVTAETRGAYAKAFFGNENVNRFMTAMEGHRGPAVYYVGALFAFFAPWCVFLLGALWYAVKDSRRQPVATGGFEPHRPARFLLCWVAAYLVFFSLAATKLPNYIAPLYPAVALLTARFLVRWRESLVAPARWLMPAAAGGMAVVGVVVLVGMLVAGGAIPLRSKGLRVMPELAGWATLGLVPLAGAAAMGWFLLKRNRPAVVRSAAIASVLFVGLLAAFPPLVVDRYKAAKELVERSGARQPERDVRLASLDYTKESVTFYAERRVARLHSAEAAAGFLALPQPAYLFVPEAVWADRVAAAVTTPHRVAARKYDFYRNGVILVVTNEPDRAVAAGR